VTHQQEKDEAVKFIIWIADGTNMIFRELEGDNANDALIKAGFEDVAAEEGKPGVWDNFDETLFEIPRGLDALKDELLDLIKDDCSDNHPGGCKIILNG
jgi:hypothetical protein